MLRILTLASCCALVISGCGLRGPLVLPPGSAPDPIFGKAKGTKSPNSIETGSESTGAVEVR